MCRSVHLCKLHVHDKTPVKFRHVSKKMRMQKKRTLRAITSGIRDILLRDVCCWWKEEFPLGKPSSRSTLGNPERVPCLLGALREYFTEPLPLGLLYHASNSWLYLATFDNGRTYVWKPAYYNLYSCLEGICNLQGPYRRRLRCAESSIVEAFMQL